MVDLKLVRLSDLWYIIGLIVTDGNLSKDGRHINITSKDRRYLFAIKKALKLKNKIGRKTRGHSKEKIYSQLQFGDVKFYKFLVDIGLSPKKSLTLGKIGVDKNYFVDFLRGVIDGDGNISTWIHTSNKHRQWSLRIVSAAPVFAEWLKNEIEMYFKVSGKLYHHKYRGKKNFINILKFGKLAAKVILQKTYYKKSFSLYRKSQQVSRCLQDKNRMINYRGILGPGAGTGLQNRLKIGCPKGHVGSTPTPGTLESA